MCEVKHQRLRWYCDTFDDSGMSATQPTISSYLKLTSVQCLEARNTGYATIGSHKVPFIKNVRKTEVIMTAILEIGVINAPRLDG